METRDSKSKKQPSAPVARSGDKIVLIGVMGELSVVGRESMRIPRTKPSVRSLKATEIYQTVRSSGELDKRSALTYRCPNRCALLHVIRTPGGVILGIPPHATSGDEPFSIDPAAYESDTEDGRRWRLRASFMPDPLRPEMPNYERLNCRHIPNRPIELATVQRDLASRRTEVIFDPESELTTVVD